MSIEKKELLSKKFGNTSCPSDIKLKNGIDEILKKLANL